jgi:hypothetical protein
VSATVRPRPQAQLDRGARWTWARLVGLAALLERRRIVVLAVFVAVNWAVIAHEALSSIHHNGWLYYHGGDGTFYWTLAHSLSSLSLPETLIGYGQPLLLMPIAAVAGPSMLAGLPAVLILNLVILAPLALLLVYLVAERIAGRLFGLWAALLWIVVPPLVLQADRASHRPTMIDNYLPMARGLNTLADYPSMVCVLAAAYFLLRTIDTRAWMDAAAAGILTGFLIGLKPSNSLFLPAAALMLAGVRRWRAAAAFAAALVPALVTLAVWKHTGLGTIPVLSIGSMHEAAGAHVAGDVIGWSPWHRYVRLDWHHLGQNIDAFRELFGSARPFEVAFVAGTIALVLRAPLKGGFVAVWFLAYFIVKGSSTVASVYDTSFYRLLEPAYPAYLLMAAAVPLAIPIGRRRRALRDEGDELRRRQVRPLPGKALAALAVVFSLVPLVVIVAAHRVPRDTVAYDGAEGLEIPIVDFGFIAKRTGNAVALAWSRPPTSGVVAGFRIFRDRTDGCTYPGAGAPQCGFAMRTWRTTQDSTFVDYGVHGRWTYRVGLAADWLSSTDSKDVLLLSKPISVSAP